MKKAFLSIRDQMMARLVAEEVAKAMSAMLDERERRDWVDRNGPSYPEEPKR
jgi:hypothetical protein